MNNSSTFSKTEVDIVSEDYEKDDVLHFNASPEDTDIAMPKTINFIQLRESFLSEAPFINKANRTMWRKLMESVKFQRIVSGCYYTVSQCISDNGTFNVEKLCTLEKSTSLKLISSNFSEIFYFSGGKQRESLFSKFPEVLTFLVTNALHVSIPKHSRMYGTCRFKEILLDYFSELFTGLRPSNCRHGRDWLFAFSNEIPISTTTGPVKERSSAQSRSVSTFTLGNSPLLSMYINASTTFKNTADLTMGLSHYPERPITTLHFPHQSKTVIGKPRMRLIDTIEVKNVLDESRKTTRAIMDDFHASKQIVRNDMKKLRDSYKLSLKWIERSHTLKKAGLNTTNPS